MPAPPPLDGLVPPPGLEAVATSPLADDVRALLHAVRVQVGMEVAWTSEFRGGTQVFRFVDAEPGARAPEPGSCLPLTGSYCAAVLDGRVPARIPDARRHPSTSLLAVTEDLQIGSYLGVPLVGPDGAVTGMLCTVSSRAAPALSERELAALRLHARLVQDLQVRALGEQASARSHDALLAAMDAVVRGEGRSIALQPIVDADGRVVAHEALSRFVGERSPAEWFHEAGRLGRRRELELGAATTALDLLRAGQVDGALAVNLSASTLLSTDLGLLLEGVEPARVVVELTEHEQVDDYAPVLALLAPWRARGLRLAVDDAGAGYASLRHVLQLRPDIAKIDMALVRGIDADLARRAVTTGLVLLAREVGLVLVAEGVETAAEQETLLALGVPHAQGFLLGRPAAAP